MQYSKITLDKARSKPIKFYARYRSISSVLNDTYRHTGKLRVNTKMSKNQLKKKKENIQPK